ncbi:hypothetical protein Q7P37_005064 [Cladosporium fusiforme]
MRVNDQVMSMGVDGSLGRKELLSHVQARAKALMPRPHTARDQTAQDESEVEEKAHSPSEAQKKKDQSEIQISDSPPLCLR